MVHHRADLHPAVAVPHLPGVLFSVASRSSVASSAMRVLGMGGVLDAANRAAAEAGSAVADAVRSVSPGTAAAVFAMNNGIATDISKIGAVDDRVPGVLRIRMARTFAQGLAGADGTFQWSTFGAGGYFTLHPLLAGS